MVITVQLATVLAQIMPTFLLLALFERFVGRRRGEPEPSWLWQRFAALCRFMVVTACLMVFTVSIVVVWTNSSVDGTEAAIVGGVIIGLMFILWIAVQVWHGDLTRRANEKMPDAMRNRRKSKDDDGPHGSGG